MWRDPLCATGASGGLGKELQRTRDVMLTDSVSLYHISSRLAGYVGVTRSKNDFLLGFDLEPICF